MISSRKITDLRPFAQRKFTEWRRLCEMAGIDVLIYCTLRDAEMQDSLYAKGRTAPGKIVTNARGGESWHNYGLAVDAVPMIGGKPQWGDYAQYRQMGELAESIGIEWAGRWTGRLKETAHFQYTQGKPRSFYKEGGKLTS